MNECQYAHSIGKCISFLLMNGKVDIGLSYTANFASDDGISPSASTNLRSFF